MPSYPAKRSLGHSSLTGPIPDSIGKHPYSSHHMHPFHHVPIPSSPPSLSHHLLHHHPIISPIIIPSSPPSSSHHLPHHHPVISSIGNAVISSKEVNFESLGHSSLTGPIPDSIGKHPYSSHHMHPFHHVPIPSSPPSLSHHLLHHHPIISPIIIPSSPPSSSHHLPHHHPVISSIIIPSSPPSSSRHLLHHHPIISSIIIPSSPPSSSRHLLHHHPIISSIIPSSPPSSSRHLPPSNVRSLGYNIFTEPIPDSIGKLTNLNAL
ncbi:unnamed protein product [Closterium sp. NIES-64]|nr:unnamed protein product [Closterium sp. NIES-64]CAI5980904.1 unnamed protein product [Closterium sp. NIES-64]